MNLYSRWRTMSGLFDTPDECCKDFLEGFYISDQPDGEDLVVRKKVVRNFFELRYRPSIDSDEMFLEKYSALESLLQPLTTEMPWLGFTYPADVYIRDSLTVMREKFKGHGFDLDLPNFKYMTHIELIEGEEVTTVFTVYRV